MNSIVFSFIERLAAIGPLTRPPAIGGLAISFMGMRDTCAMARVNIVVLETSIFLRRIIFNAR